LGQVGVLQALHLDGLGVVGIGKTEPHEIAGLDLMGFKYPVREVLGLVLKPAGGDGGAAAEVRQIGTAGLDLRVHAVTAGAILDKQIRAVGDLLGINGFRILLHGHRRVIPATHDRLLLLAGQPGIPVFLVEGLGTEQHVGVRIAAVLRTLPPEIAGLVGLDPHEVLLARHEVGLARQLGQPETVDDVVGVEVQLHRAPGRKDQLVGGMESVFGIFKSPPPLVAGHVDLDRPFLVFHRHLLFQDNPAKGRNGNDHEQRRGGNHKAHLNQRMAVGLLRHEIRVVTLARTELPDGEGQRAADGDEQEQRDPQGDVKDVRLVLRNGSLRIKMPIAGRSRS
jgi:hypothetical protein